MYLLNMAEAGKVIFLSNWQGLAFHSCVSDPINQIGSCHLALLNGIPAAGGWELLHRCSASGAAAQQVAECFMEISTLSWVRAAESGYGDNSIKGKKL